MSPSIATTGLPVTAFAAVTRRTSGIGASCRFPVAGPQTSPEPTLGLVSANWAKCPEADQRPPDRHGLFFCRETNQG
jgi:hypothetical protein